MKTIFITCFILLLNIISCKTQKKIDSQVINKNALNLDAYQGDFNPNNVENPNAVLTLKESDKYILIYNGSISLLNDKSSILDSIDKKKFTFKEIKVNKGNNLVFDNIEIDKILIIEKR